MTKKVALLAQILLLLLLMTGVVEAITSANNVNYLSHDDSQLSGTYDTDLAGNMNGSISGVTTGASGVLEEAYTYSDTDYVRVLDHAAIDDNQELTINFWWKGTDTAANANFVMKSNGGSDYQYLVNGWSATGRLICNALSSAGGGVSYAGSTSPGIYDGAWHMITCTIENAVETKLYVDSISIANSSSWSGTWNYEGAGYLQWGARQDSGSQAKDGDYDELSVWDTLLTRTDISDLYNGGSGYSPYSNSAPSVSITQYDDNDHTNDVPLNFTYSVTDNEGDDANCSLYFNGGWNTTTNNIPSGTSTYFSVDAAEGSYTWLIQCTDGVAVQNTSSRTVILDVTPPDFTVYGIAADNSSTYVREENSTIWFNDTWEDTYMFAYNQTVWYPNGTVADTWNATGLTGLKEWTNHSFSLTGKPSGEYTYQAVGEDDHTATAIPDYLVTSTNQRLEFVTPTNTIAIEPEIGNFRSLTATKLFDRYTFTFEAVTARSEWGFVLFCDEKLWYREGLYPYPSFVCGHHWVDFNAGGLSDIVVTRRSVDRYSINFRTSERSELSFSSLGGLNSREENYTFTVNNNNPPELNLTFTVDPLYEDNNEIASCEYIDAENHTGSLAWYWYVEGASVYNDTTASAVNGTTYYSTLSSGNFSSGESVNVTVVGSDTYNFTTVSDVITVSTAGGGGNTYILLVNHQWFW